MPNSRKSTSTGGGLTGIVKNVHMPGLCDIKRDEKYDAMIARMKRRLEEKKKKEKTD